MKNYARRLMLVLATVVATLVAAGLPGGHAEAAAVALEAFDQGDWGERFTNGLH